MENVKTNIDRCWLRCKKDFFFLNVKKKVFKKKKNNTYKVEKMRYRGKK